MFLRESYVTPKETGISQTFHDRDHMMDVLEVVNAASAARSGDP